MKKLAHIIGVTSILYSMTSGIVLAKDESITSPSDQKIQADFDIIHTKVTSDGNNLVFEQEARDTVGKSTPEAHGKLAGADVYSYVWPTSLNSSAAGFEADQGILALALTIHPDFDDTPLYDEDGDGNKADDGGKWHTHWVVLTKDEACGKDGMKVKDIPEGTKPKLPATWPNLPIFIDSPGYDFSMDKKEVIVKVPLKALGFPKTLNYDGVTSALRINANVHAPLLCIANVWDIASGNLSLPGKVGGDEKK